MKVVILGPAISDTISGGVAVFDEGLFNGFVLNGDEPYLISANKSSVIDNLLVSNKEIKPNQIVFHLRDIAKLIRKIEPDIVISSLQYSIGIKIYKKYYKKCKYVQVLHGFPCEINGRSKAWAINRVARFSRKHFDYLVTVSFLSYAINKKINRVLCDKVIYNGSQFLPDYDTATRDIDFAYIGRLFRDKEVEMIVESFLKLKKRNPGMRFVVAGYGELESKFREPRYANSGIEFSGKLNQKQVHNLLSRTKFFISMNPLEPFGIVFSEALLSGCNIITQSTAGCAPIYIKNNYFHIADCLDSSSLSLRLEDIHKRYHKISDEEMRIILEYASYKRVAKEYKELVQNII